MPRYEITSPDGRKFEVTAPEGATQDEVLQYAQANFAQFAPPKPSTIGGELVRGGKQLVSSAQTAAGALFGSPEEAAKAGVERGQQIAAEAGQGPSLEAVQKAYRDKGLLSAAGEAVSQIPKALAGQAANLATMAGGARLGAMAGAPLGPAGVIGGGIAGAGAALLPQFFGANVERQAQEQIEAGKPVDINRAKAGAAALGQAAIEGAGTAFTLGKGLVKGVLGIADDAALMSAKAQQELVKTAQRSLGGAAATGAARGAAEIPVEIAQQILERAQAGLSLTSPDALKEYGESAYQAGLVGGPLGAAGGAYGRGAAQKQLAAQAAAQPPVPPTPPAIPPAAPAGAQGELFTPQDLAGLRRGAEPTPPAQPAAPAPAEPTGEQLGLGLEDQRKVEDLFLERERLKKEPQTPEVKARLADVSERIKSYLENEYASIQQDLEAQKAAEAEDAATRKRFPALAEAPIIPRGQTEMFGEEELPVPEEPTRTLMGTPVQPKVEPTEPAAPKGTYQYKAPLRTVPAGKEVNRFPKPAKPVVPEPKMEAAPVAPAAGAITSQTLDDMGIQGKGVRGWFEKNVVGKTVDEVRAETEKNPALLTGKGERPQLLRELIAPKAEPFDATQKTTPTPVVEPGLEPGTSEPSVSVPSKPARARAVPPRGRRAAAPSEPAPPVGGGLADTGQPAVARDGDQGAQRSALETAEQRRARLRAEKAAREEKTTHEAVMDGKPVVVEIIRDKTSETYKGVKNVVEVRIKGATRLPMTLAYGGYDSDAEVLANLRESEVLDDQSKQTSEEEAQRQREAQEMQERMREQQGREARAKVAPPKVEIAPRAERTEPIPEKLYEPTGTSEYGMEPGKKEIIRGPQAMLFPMSKREEIEYAERPKAEEAAAEEEAPTRDERQRELDFTKAPEPAPKEDWTKPHVTDGYSLVYSDDEVALVRGLNMLNEAVYFPMARDGFVGSKTINATKSGGALGLTDAQIERLKPIAARAAAEEAELAKQNPDGPFAGATENVIGSESIEPRYVDYLNKLMQSLGLGNIKVFMYTDADTRAPDAYKKYNLRGIYTQLQRFRPRETQGALRSLGNEQTFGMFVRPGRSEADTLETISHELGHIIEHNLANLADAPTRAALKAEYEEWLGKAKKMNVSDFVHSLRNRNDAEGQRELLEGSFGKKAATELDKFTSYWASYGEWFADNVSRWATTNEKPLTITEKFFSKVAQKMRDLVALVTGRKYPPAKTVADFLNKMGPADFSPVEAESRGVSPKEEFSVSVSTASLVDSMGPLDPEDKGALTKLVDSFKLQGGVDYTTTFRTQVADIGATIEARLRKDFDGAVRDSLGNVNPMGLYRQAQDYTKMLLEYFQRGGLSKDPNTKQWMVTDAEGVRPPAAVYELIDKWAAKNGYTRERGTQIASRVLEGVRLDQMRASNQRGETDFALHLKDPQIDQLVAEYNADPDLQEMSKLMDEARVALVDHLVQVGRLSPEEGKAWGEVIGYVPFDRISEETLTNFRKIKKVSGKGLAHLGKLPELVGSIERPVGNVFDNYIDTLGWMVGQIVKNDATVQTLRALEDIGSAKFLHGSTQGRPNTVGAYIDGEMKYWELPSKYDVMAFKDLNPPKAGWLLALGRFSNVLRKSVTVLPPFALKQVTDDVQRAIITSGVKNPGALMWMALTNFPKLAVAELRGIQHPMVREFGALGLTGEYDFEAGKPAKSLLKDLGYKPRGKFETLIHRLDGITRASDLSVRKAIYDQTMKETQDALLAQTRAREFINFRRRGASDFVGAMVTTIPFFNAYIQGMDVLYRAASGKDSSSSVGRAQARRMFWSRAGTVFMLSSLYALGKGDDDEYEEMDLRTRDSNWILPGGVKIAAPGELGALFKVIPERIVEYMRRQGTPEEQTAWEATHTALTYMYEQYIGRVTPVPQAVKPIMEAWANKSFLTGRQLEGFHHLQMDPTMRRTEQTSELAVAIANFSRDTVGVEVSPIMVDNALRGYFGTSAALLTMTTDSLLNPTRVDRPLHKYALLSNYLYDPVGTRRVTEFYETRDSVGKTGATLRELMKTDIDRAVKYAEEHQDDLMLEKAVNSTLNQLEKTRAYRKYLNSPDGAAAMPADVREAELVELRKMEVDLTRWVREAKAALPR